MKKFQNEKDGQLEFYESYLNRVDRSLQIDEIITNNTDGVLNGNILEFKLKINDVNSVLFQTIKYLSSMRIKGKEIPKNIILISLNKGLAYIYNSKDYLRDIEKVYVGSGSKDNKGFIANEPLEKLNYGENVIDEERLIKLLKEKKYTKINIDENCIVGWAERFYHENSNAKKSDFIGDLEGKVKIVGEIREPNKFKDYINKYEGGNNVKFQYLMDKLNDKLQQKTLGAFYTPELYVNKALELVREAIERVPEGNDYIILDRCAGTGNLEKLMTNEELSHCIVSTIEYYEYKVLMELLGDKVRHIIPPTEKEDTFNMGLVRGADALSREFVECDIIKQYINNPKCSIIVFENPPYAETTSIEHQKQGKAKENSAWKQNYVVQEMKKEVKGVASNDLANAFIWSAFKFYLRQPTDSLVVFSPIKYWKGQSLINKKFIKGYGFNRKFFHTTTDAFISCILWSNEDDNIEELTLNAYNIKDGKVEYEKDILIKKVKTLISQKFTDKTDNDCEKGIFSNIDGTERSHGTTKPCYRENYIGFIDSHSFSFENVALTTKLTRNTMYDGHGFHLRKENFLEKLPIFTAGKYTHLYCDWTIKSQLMKTADGYENYIKDVKNGKLKNYLLKTLLWISLSHLPHMRSLNGSDGRFYRNELCLDTTNGETLASEHLKNFKYNEDEQKLLLVWNKIINQAKQTTNYNPQFTYGLYQIDEELNTKYKDEKGKNMYDYPELNGNIKTLKTLLKDYYLKELAPTLFEYEFLK